MDKYEVLKQYFGHSSFRDGQEKLIDNILSGRDCLGVMPTGAGKSMCYQIPALMSEGITLVISPLISLMKDQVESLIQQGVPAAYINSSLDDYEYMMRMDDICSGLIKIIYVAPERLSAPDFFNRISRLNISLVAVDEAHCVSHWGQDFRPSYLRITQFVNNLSKRPVVASFTATATDVVKRDIVNILELRNPFCVTTGFDRQNLYFEVRKPKNRDAELLEIIRGSHSGSTIVYCSTRKNVEKVCAFLRLNGCAAEQYHAGMPDIERKSSQESFVFDRCNIIVATNAFGMGIDKSDVSLVVHYNMPKDLESYYQEAGRAGRDGSPARCILLYSGQDVRVNEFLIEKGHETETDLSEEEIEKIRERDKQRLKKMTFYSTTQDCLRGFILGYFGDSHGSFCGNCSNCNANYETLEITIDAQKILSCIFRLKQRNMQGDSELISCILCGNNHPVIDSNNLTTLSTYGIMKDIAITRVNSELKFLTEEGYIEEDSETHSLSLTELADKFIRKRSNLLMKIPKSEAKPAEAIKQEPPHDEELFVRLKAVRKSQAEIYSVPAYVIFSDVTLREMSAKKPVTNADFLKISGIGSRKAEQYGEKFMRVIRDYIAEKK